MRSTDKPLTVKANGASVTCEYLVIATHVPLQGKPSIVERRTCSSRNLHLYTSYAIGAKVPKGTIPQALFWDTSDPYQYLRVDDHPRHQYAIFGGEDHKTGQERRYRRTASASSRDLFAAHVPKRPGQAPLVGSGRRDQRRTSLIGETAERSSSPRAMRATA